MNFFSYLCIKKRTRDMDAIKEIKHKGYRIEIHYDTDSDSPRNWDNLGTIYSNHRRYDFDGHDIKELIEEVGGNIYDSVIPWKLIGKKYIYLKVWMYDHSGVTVRTGETNPFGCPWDSGLYGVIVCDIEKAKKVYGYKRNCKGLRDKVTKCLDGEIKTLDAYCCGEVYGFRTFKGDEEIDSCWGFYDIDEAIAEAKGVVDYEYEKEYGESLFPDYENAE